MILLLLIRSIILKLHLNEFLENLNENSIYLFIYLFNLFHFEKNLI